MNQQLKQRLVGAAVLALLGGVFIPMVLSGPPEPPREEERARVALNPQAKEGGFSSRIVPLPGAAPGQPAALNPARPDAAPAANRSPSGGAGHEPERAKPAAVPPVPAPAPGAVGAAPAQGWVIQLGSFTNARNALALRDRLKQEGYRAFVESVKRGKRKVTRVLIGPELERGEALSALESLHRATKLRGIVVRYPDPAA